MAAEFLPPTTTTGLRQQRVRLAVVVGDVGQVLARHAEEVGMVVVADGGGDVARARTRASPPLTVSTPKARPVAAPAEA